MADWGAAALVDGYGAYLVADIEWPLNEQHGTAKCMSVVSLTLNCMWWVGVVVIGLVVLVVVMVIGLIGVVAVVILMAGSCGRT